VLGKAGSRTAQMTLSDFLHERAAVLYSTVLHVNLPMFSKFLFVFFLSEYSQIHNTVSGNPNQRTLLTPARLWLSTKTPF